MANDLRALADLWTEEAVRLENGGRAEIGTKAIQAGDERGKAEHPGLNTGSYAPDIKDVTITDM